MKQLHCSLFLFYHLPTEKIYQSKIIHDYIAGEGWKEKKAKNNPTNQPEGRMLFTIYQINANHTS